MTTFRDLLISLQSLSDAQLDQQVMIIPTGYCSAAAVEIDGFSPFTGKIEIAISKGDIIYEEGADTSQCGGCASGCSDTEEWATPASELKKEMGPDEKLYSNNEIVLSPGLPYIRISNFEE